MDSPDDKIKQLEERVADLEARLAELADKEARDVKALMAYDDTLDLQHLTVLAELTDAVDRILHIELLMFPKLHKAIDNLYEAMSGDSDTRFYNPLDFRGMLKKIPLARRG